MQARGYKTSDWNWTKFCDWHLSFKGQLLRADQKVSDRKYSTEKRVKDSSSLDYKHPNKLFTISLQCRASKLHIFERMNALFHKKMLL